nr:toprim domain-containing protein [Acetobacter estunensis]
MKAVRSLPRIRTVRGPDARTLSHLLAERIVALAPELLRAGHREGCEWRCGSLAGEKGQSLAVRLTGPRRGVWCDFSGGQKGDALDLVAAVLFAGSRRDAMAWAKNWLGIGDSPVPQPTRQQISEKTNNQDLDRDEQRRRAKARELWHQTPAGIADTPVELYLRGRGIDLREMGRAPGSLRFNPAVWCAEVERPLPAMLAAICGANGKQVAVHRTWLVQTASGMWTKADLRASKKVLGSFAGGSIRLWRGATGKSLGMAEPGESVIVAEGIETGLSVALACPEYRTLCAVSLSNMGRLELPEAITDIIIAADNDAGNESARKALDAACQKFIEQGRIVRVAMPETKGRDWNDVIREENGPKDGART